MFWGRTGPFLRQNTSKEVVLHGTKTLRFLCDKYILMNIDIQLVLDIYIIYLIDKIHPPEPIDVDFRLSACFDTASK